MSDVIIQRVVVRQDLSLQLATLFIKDLQESISALDHAHIIIYGHSDENKGALGFTH